MKRKPTATEAIMGKRIRCCSQWKRLVYKLHIIPKDGLGQAFETIVKSFLGSYCPCCGRKL